MTKYELSATFNHDGHRSHPPVRPRYASLKTRRRNRCDECFVQQHENPRAQRMNNATFQREIYGNVLFLCTPHAFLWKERDAEAESDTRGPRVL
jgi:hypothetical protein